MEHVLCTTGQQIAQSAASDGAAASAAVNEEEVRGPHASLAVRLQVKHFVSRHSLHVIQRTVFCDCIATVTMGDLGLSQAGGMLRRAAHAAWAAIHFSLSNASPAEAGSGAHICAR